ncbi:hypothetical protein PV515_48210, partial [Streptomyces scabiei]|nr:hypothetical protein [Streptomyces scabiei]
MALAAGALSLLRVASDPVGGGASASGPAPSAADGFTDEATTEAGTTVTDEPPADAGTPTSDAPMGGGTTASPPPRSPGAAAPTPVPSTLLPAPGIGVEIPSD